MYRINWYVDDASIDVNPIYGEDLKLSLTQESNEYYYRCSLEGEFTFCNEDFDLLYSASLSSVFRAEFWNYRTINSQVISTKVCDAYFTKMDIRFDMDNRIASVKAVVADKYEKILAGLDNEYDLIKLSPPRTEVEMRKRAVLQIYVMGDTKVSNVVGNLSYEVDAQSGIAAKNGVELVQQYGLSALKRYLVITVDRPVGDALFFMNGNYVGEIDGVENRLTRTDGLYYLSEAPVNDGSSTILYLCNPNGTLVPYETTGYIGVQYNTENPAIRTALNVYTSEGTFTQVGTVLNSARNIYGRILNDKDSPTETAYIIRDDDISERNFNYRYAYNETDAAELFTNIKNALVISLKTQTAPTPWMQDSNGKYFVEPDKAEDTNIMIAIGWSCWIPMSFWFDCPISVAAGIAEYDQPWVLRDAIPIKDTIELLLAQIDPSLGFYSEFLDDTSLVPVFPQIDLSITPITNIKKTYYEQPAQKGIITLKQILDLLRICFGCYWYIDKYTVSVSGAPVDRWRLRIEQSTWFRNGGTYDGELSSTLIDLTRITAPLTDKSWAFGQNTIEFDKAEFKKRIEFSWAEDCSVAFNGYPIVYEDGYLSDMGTQKNNVSNFIADVDLIISSPANLSDDVFVVLGSRQGQIYYDLVGSYSSPSVLFYLQNSALSFFELERQVGQIEMYGSSAKLEGLNLPLSVYSLKRMKKQEVSAPFEIYSVEMGFGKVITGVDSGQFLKITTTLASEFSEFEILCDTN